LRILQNALNMVLCDRTVNQSDNTSSKLWNYDVTGNPLSDGAATFTWNAAGKLSTTVKDAKTHTYKTNGLDQRISKNGPLSAKFFFFYDPAGQLIGEYRDNSSTATPTDDWLVRQETIW